jgi:Tol biopolymer transport system component
MYIIIYYEGMKKGIILILIYCASLAFSSPQGNNKNTIVFVSDRTGNCEIYLINADGTGLKRLTNNTSYDNRPEWSPDGKQIIFCSERDNKDEDLYIMDADGSNVKRITNTPYREYFPTWSPDGNQIAFTSRKNDYAQTFIMNIDGTGLRELRKVRDADFHPCWSPDGKKMAIAIFKDGLQNIFTINIDGTGLKPLTTTHAMTPSWSPDGKKIAFSGASDEYNLDIYIIDADGSNLRQLTKLQGHDEFPDWSPDGQKLTKLQGHDEFPDWSPDGQKLLFENRGSIYIINADGTDLKNITPYSKSNTYGKWRPKQEE